MAIAVASGAIQAAVVAPRPIPKFAKRVIDLEGPGTSNSDSILAKLSRGESVMISRDSGVQAHIECHSQGIQPGLNEQYCLEYAADEL